MLRGESVLCGTRLLVITGLLAAMMQSRAAAALMTTLTDGGGSSVNVNFSGSTTYSGANVGDISFQQILLPITGSWKEPFNIGNWLIEENDFSNIDSTSNPFVAKGNFKISVSGKSDVSFDVDRVIIKNATNSQDSISFQTTSSFPNYPSITTTSTDDVISWTGSVTFDVDSGTFATNFNESPIPYTADHGNGIEVALQIVPSAVPEPSGLMLALLGGMTIALLAYRSRFQVRVVS